MDEQEQQENKEIDKQVEETEIDFGIIKDVIKKLTVEHYIIIALALMMVAMFYFHLREIDACNVFYQGVVNEIKAKTIAVTLF